MNKNLVHQVRQILHGYNMCSAGDRLGIAVSGGADSVVLLHILNLLAQDLLLNLSVLHINHGLRGAESDADEIFVRDLADTLQLDFLCHRESINAGNIEQEARKSRQRFFKNCLQEHGCHRIALGHTRTDQAETVLFRLLRGSGLTGLAGMRPVTRTGIIRPLLGFSREEVRLFATSANLVWREDSSNDDVRFRRNRLRLITMPQLRRDYNSGLDSVLAAAAAVAQGEEDYWLQRTERLYQEVVVPTPYGATLSVSTFQQLHLAEQRRILRHAMRVVRRTLVSIEAAHIEDVRRICFSRHGHDRVMLPGIDAIRSFDTLLLALPETMKQSRDYQLTIEYSRPLRLPLAAGYLVVDPVPCKGQNCVTVKDELGGGEDAYLDGGVLLKAGTTGLQVRNWQPGDRFQPLGAASHSKIKTLFQESRIALWERRHWPVIVAGTEIAWVRQFGAAAQFQPVKNSSKLLQIRYRSANLLSGECR